MASSTSSSSASSRFALRRETHFGERVVRCYADRPRSVLEMFERARQRGPHREALVFEDRRFSWQDLHDHSARLAHALAAQGVGPGDRVVLLLSNRPEFIFTLIACLKLGAIAVPVSVREQAPGLAFIVAQCAARAVVFDDELLERLPPLHDAASLTVRVSAHEAARIAHGSGPMHDDVAQVAEEDTAVILYTSGTTGRPKGAMLCHLGIVHSSMHYEDVMQLGKDERAVLAVPASHVTGLVALVTTMWQVGGALVMLAQFKAPDFIATASRERVSYTMLVPAMYALCLLQPAFSTTDLSHWRIGAYGGAPMPQASIEALARTLPGMTLLNAYGSTEVSSPATVMPLGEQAAHLDSVGKALPCVDIVVMNDDGIELAAGETGELMIGGPMTVRGYWDNPEATAREFIGGYWRSGDLGAVDAQGFVKIFDRKKDMINRGGYKIWSVEVENTLVGFPGVIEAAAVGVPCPVLGERVHAFVHATEPAPDPAALRAWCTERLSDYKVPETVTVRPEPLPRNANGKLLKREMRGWLPAAKG